MWICNIIFVIFGLFSDYFWTIFGPVLVPRLCSPSLFHVFVPCLCSPSWFPVLVPCTCSPSWFPVCFPVLVPRLGSLNPLSNLPRPPLKKWRSHFILFFWKPRKPGKLVFSLFFKKRKPGHFFFFSVFVFSYSPFSVLCLGSYSWFPVFILSLGSPSLFPPRLSSPSLLGQ